ncbi:MAG: nucleoside-diphosphate sugar epimerase/dehydratase [Deltaproteobacteria bacterium]|nr:nucleoside-diphosphate sugar epimerase/dehydratase [Deltaproteobacteria bacterium]
MPARTLDKLKSYYLYFLSQHMLRFKKKSTSVHFWIMVVTDVLFIMLAYVLAHYLRFEALRNSHDPLSYLFVLPVILGVKLPVFYVLGLYNGMWRYTGLRDLQNIIKAVLLSSAIIVSIMLFVNRFQGFSRSVFIMDAILTLLFISGSRVSIRCLFHHNHSRQQERQVRKKRLLLIGAGDAAEQVVREIAANPLLPYKVVGFVDDDPTKTGMWIHGIPILGGIDDLVRFVDQAAAEELLIAVSAITGQQMKRIVGLCQQTGLPYKVLPGLGELINGTVSVKAIRDISYNDLLGREEVKLDQEKIGGYVTGKTVMVTGAGGSIGSELCRQLLRFHPKRLILFDSGEENLYSIQMEMEHEYSFNNYVTVLGQVQNKELLKKVFSQYKPEVVFHAAAYKHVPLVEINPWEAVTNNILAAKYLLEASIAHGVHRFVLVSTDKAVRPTNVMGASKRITELLMLAYGKTLINSASSQASDNHHTIFQAVRFGNVLGSSGSVIPLFKRQIEMGGPVTITHPDITRYFMSIEEAAQLIIQAGAMGAGGEIFLLKMGTPVKIADLARDLIQLMGFEPETDIKITCTGLRPGEKLYEELITEGEGIVPTQHEKIMVLCGNGKSLHEMEKLLDELAGMATSYDAPGIKEIFKKILPEYTSDLQAKSIIG